MRTWLRKWLGIDAVDRERIALATAFGLHLKSHETLEDGVFNLRKEVTSLRIQRQDKAHASVWPTNWETLEAIELQKLEKEVTPRS